MEDKYRENDFLLLLFPGTFFPGTLSLCYDLTRRLVRGLYMLRSGGCDKVPVVIGALRRIAKCRDERERRMARIVEIFNETLR